ncbi:histamine H2 receptor [Nematostella vectensis]|uniref:histamine H2 receptor n=1 Tax=Nematostella vectensis TaxID=45351 RepID=UPI00139061A0|nr:histamine H2 receptor [Nematostella vectensis]
MSKDNLGTQISLAVISMCGMTMNALVCYIVYKHRTMRNYTNCLVVSLACSDVIMAAVLFCQYLISFHSPTASNILYAIAMFSGIANLCAVTFDRHTAVTQPLRYLNLMSRYFRRIVVCVWIGSIVLSVLPVLWVGEGSSDGHAAYVITTLVVCILTPFLFILFSHCCIFYHARRITHRDRRLNRCLRSKRGRVTNTEYKVARIFALVAAMFLISWLPVIYYTTAAVFKRIDLVPQILLDLSPITLALGTVVNPLIYSLMKPDFRLVVKKMIHCKPAQENVNPSSTFESPRTMVTEERWEGREERAEGRDKMETEL